jgi:hypothetical protein
LLASSRALTFCKPVVSASICEFLKERGKVKKLEATVEKQQRDFQAIAAQQQKRSSAALVPLRRHRKTAANRTIGLVKDVSLRAASGS